MAWSDPTDFPLSGDKFEVDDLAVFAENLDEMATKPSVKLRRENNTNISDSTDEPILWGDQDWRDKIGVVPAISYAEQYPGGGFNIVSASVTFAADTTGVRRLDLALGTEDTDPVVATRKTVSALSGRPTSVHVVDLVETSPGHNVSCQVWQNSGGTLALLSADTEEEAGVSMSIDALAGDRAASSPWFEPPDFVADIETTDVDDGLQAANGVVWNAYCNNNSRHVWRRPCARLTLNADTVADATWKTVNDYATDFDNADLYDSGEPARLTPSRRGWWMCGASIGFAANATGARQVWIGKGGETAATHPAYTFSEQAVSGHTGVISGIQIRLLDPDDPEDFMFCQVRQTSGGTLGFGANVASHFWMAFMGDSA